MITLYEIGELFGSAYQRAATTQTAVNGFKATGICPFNSNIFPDELFRPAETTDRPEINAEENNISSHRNSSSEKIPERDVLMLPGCSNEKNPSPRSNNGTPLSELVEHQENVPTSSCSQNIAQAYFSPQDIMPLPQAGPRKTKRRRLGKTMILTATPNFEELKTKSADKIIISKENVTRVKRNLGGNKGSKGKKRSKKESSDTEESIKEVDLSAESSSNDNPDSDDESYPSKKEFFIEKINDEDVKVEDFLYVELTTEKHNIKKEFVAQVISAERGEEHMSITVRFLRQYRQTRNIFVFPEVPDESELFEGEIRGKLTTKKLRHGKIEVL